MKILGWILAGVIAIPVCFFIRNKAIGPEGWAKENTVKALQSKLKDPGSLVIRDSYILKKGEPDAMTISYCGLADGKNSFGALTGGSRFASRSVSTKDTFDTYSVEMESPEELAVARSVNMLSPFEKVYWNDYCVDETHPAIAIANPTTNVLPSKPKTRR